MSLQHRLPDHVVRADPWTLFCVECARKMRIVTASPAEKGRETRIYKCACGHSERIDLALPPLSEPRTTTGSSTIWTTKDRANLLQPSERDAMLAAVPKLRAFAISLSRSVDRADDLVQETLLRAIAKINSFQPGTNISAWLFTILRNVFRSEYRKRCREVEDADGNYADSLKSAPEQHGRVKFEEVRRCTRDPAAQPARSRAPCWRVGLLLRGSSYDLQDRGRDDQEPGQSCTHEALGAALGRLR